MARYTVWTGVCSDSPDVFEDGRGGFDVTDSNVVRKKALPSPCSGVFW